MAVLEKQNRIERLFKEREENEKVMSLFITAGYPDLESTPELILGFEQNGADMIELGIPFSDPLADGPTIQYSSEVAIKNGITIDQIMEMVRKVREESEIPILLMGYMNPVLQYGIENFFQKASGAGVDGVIIPDIPPEEAGIIEQPAVDYGISVVYLVAPNTSDRRMQLIDRRSGGFVYCVSVTGVTGARDGDEVAKSVKRFINRVIDNITGNPRMVGFGIRSYEDAQRVAAEVEGYIVGSALIDVIRKNYPEKGWKDKVFAFVQSLKYGNQ